MTGGCLGHYFHTMPFRDINRKMESDLGWAFVALIDGGRIKEYADDGADITRIYGSSPRGVHVRGPAGTRQAPALERAGQPGA